MICYAVIDTNVLVSALLSSNAAATVQENRNPAFVYREIRYISKSKSIKNRTSRYERFTVLRSRFGKQADN